jgi:hypothetical protein
MTKNLLGFLVSCSLVTVAISTVFFGLTGCSTLAAHESSHAEDSTILGITPGLQTFTDAQTKIGDADVYHESFIGRNFDYMCFKGPDGTVLVFESSNPETHLISQVKLARSGESSLKDKCMTSDRVDSTTTFANGVNLNTKPEAVRALYGMPTKESPNQIFYSRGAFAQTFEMLGGTILSYSIIRD